MAKKIKTNIVYPASENIWTADEVKQLTETLPEKKPNECIIWPYKFMLVAIFLFVLWQVANPHFVEVSDIKIDCQDAMYHEYECVRQIPYDAPVVCTKETTIQDLNSIHKKWATGGQCAYIGTSKRLIMFGLG